MARSAQVVVLLTIVVILSALLPIVAGEDIVVGRFEKGPKANATTWTYESHGAGAYSVTIENHGLRTMVLDVYDNSTMDNTQISHERISFVSYGAYPTGLVNSTPVLLAANHTYLFTATPNGPKGAYAVISTPSIDSPPLAQIWHYTYRLTAYFDASESNDSDGQIVSYLWTFGDGTNGSGVTTSHKYASAGYYSVSLTVTDDDGLTGMAYAQVIIYEPPPPKMPMADIGYSVNGLNVTVDGSSSWDPDGWIETYAWSFGDGGTAYGRTVTHQYPAPGEYTVVLVVTDNEGYTGTATRSILVTGESRPPLPEGWQDAKMLQMYPEYEQAGTVGVDDQGNAIVLWEQMWGNSTNDSGGVWWIKYDHNAGWGTAAKLWNASFACGYTTLAMGPTGVAVAAWWDDAYPGAILHLSLYDPATGWDTPASLQMSTGWGEMAAAVDDNGNAMVVIQGQPNLELTAWRHEGGSGWQRDNILTGGGAWPRLHYDASGCALLVWNDFDSYQVKSSRYVPGSGWGPVMVASGSVGGYWAEMDVEDSGVALVDFFISNGTAWNMYGNVFDPVNGWGVPTHIGPVANGWHPYGGFVASGAPGEFFMIWQQTDRYEGGNNSVWSRTCSFDGWSDPVRLDTGRSSVMGWTNIAASDNGEAFASWTEGSGSLMSIVCTRYTPGQGWGVPVEIDTSDTQKAWLSSADMASNGDTVVIWRQSDGVNDLLWGRVYAPEKTTPAATYAKLRITNGMRISIVSITATDIPWGDVRVRLSDGTNSVEWDPVTSDMVAGSAITKSYGVKNLGALPINCNVTDLSGNGLLNGGDYFALQGPFETTTTYTFTLIYKVTGEAIGTEVSFSG